jgi:hypothetical protein
VGPTSDLINDVQTLSGAISSGTWVASDTNRFRRMLPFQNLFYLRRLLDAVEEGVNDLAGIPKSRTVTRR